nr:hybrid signal transduction histidine kinase M [Tanacetum cinerariifolium]
MTVKDNPPPPPPTLTDKIIPFSIPYKVPIKLNIEKHNYNYWSSFSLIHVGSLVLKSHVETNTVSTNPEWCQLDDFIKMWILGSLCGSLQEQVVTTPGNAKALWDHLKNLFHDNKNARAINLDSIKIGKMTLNDYYTKIQAIENRLKNLDCEVSERNMAIFSVNGLDSRFATLAQIIRHREPLLTFETVRNMLLLNESSFNDDSTFITFESSSSSLTILMASFTSMTKASGPGTLAQPLQHTQPQLTISAHQSAVYMAHQQDFLTRHILLRCDCSSDLYPVTKSSNLTVAFVYTSSSTWHQCLDHLRDEVLRSFTSRRFISCNKEKSSHVFHACQLGKHAKLPFHSSDSIVTKCFDIIHSDLWTTPTVSSSGFKYYVLFLDHFSHYVWIYPLKHKSDMFGKFMHFRAYVKISLKVKLKVFNVIMMHKFHAGGTLSRYKARLVANDSNQQHAVDVIKTFSLVVKPTTIRTVLSLDVSRRWPIHQLNVKNAFLNGDLHETVYMHHLHGFVDSRYHDHLCLLKRSIFAYYVFLGDNLLSWSAKRQHTISRSSAEAEYRGVANVVAETAWHHNLLRELHSLLLTATLVYCDNAGHVRVLHVPSCFQYADIFPKGLPSTLFEDFRSSLSVRPPPT